MHCYEKNDIPRNHCIRSVTDQTADTGILSKIIIFNDITLPGLTLLAHFFQFLWTAAIFVRKRKVLPDILVSEVLEHQTPRSVKFNE